MCENVWLEHVVYRTAPRRAAKIYFSSLCRVCSKFNNVQTVKVMAFCLARSSFSACFSPELKVRRMECHSTLHTRQSSIQNNKYLVSHKYSCFSWWWEHCHPKHVEKTDKHTKKNSAPSWLYLQGTEVSLHVVPLTRFTKDIVVWMQRCILSVFIKKPLRFKYLCGVLRYEQFDVNNILDEFLFHVDN
jgi:hypothetical protein